LLPPLCTSETLVSYNDTTQHQNPEDPNLNLHHHVNLIPHVIPNLPHSSVIMGNVIYNTKERNEAPKKCSCKQAVVD
jgi:hypothetical protein